jgi:small GTP-binding protein
MADSKKANDNQVPAGLNDATKILWNQLSPADRKAVEDIIHAFPSQTNLFQLLYRLAANQFKMAFGKKSRVAIVGPTNVGKSTLYNQFVRDREDQAAVSPVPGTTKENQLADAGLFSVVDTPGADAIGDQGRLEQDQAFDAAYSADILILVFDAIQGIKRTELELYERLVDLKKPVVVVINKIDLVRKEKNQVIEKASQVLNLEKEQIIPIVAKSGEGLSEVLVALATAEPQIIAALGKAMPQYRWQLAWRSIVSAASASAVIALTPLPVVDFIPLVATQSVMVLSIARIYNYEITLERAREIAATFGLGLLGRILFQELSKLGGVPGWLLSAAIAASTTVVMGYAASIWFETGEKLSNETLKKITSEITNTLLNRLRGKNKGVEKKSLKEEIEQTLNDLPVSKDRSEIHSTDHQ